LVSRNPPEAAASTGKRRRGVACQYYDQAVRDERDYVPVSSHLEFHECQVYSCWFALKGTYFHPDKPLVLLNIVQENTLFRWNMFCGHVDIRLQEWLYLIG
jgi:hypothetical protein